MRQGGLSDVIEPAARRRLLCRLESGGIGGAVVVTGAAFLVLALGRWLVAAHRHIGAWVLAGVPAADPAKVPPGLPVKPTAGYDGEFYYRIALDPWDFRHTAHGITIDTAERLGRIGYPFLAWVASGGGRPSLVPWSLAAVNLIALLAISFLGARLAIDAGRSGWWGLAFSGFCGFEFSFSRDLCEPTSGAFAIAGIVALRRRRWVLAAVLFASAALCRETTLVYVGGWLLYRAFQVTRRRARLGAPDLVWAVPLVVFAIWQIIVDERYGALPLTAASGHNSSPPFVGLIAGIRHLVVVHRALDILGLAHLAVLGVVITLSALAIKTTRNPVHERVMWVLALAFSTCIGSGVWSGDDDVRAFGELWFLCALIVLAAPPRIRERRLFAFVIGATWLVGLGHSIVTL